MIAEAIDLIKRSEGLYLKRYICAAGVPTIGYGCTRWWDGGPIPVGATITPEQTEQLLRRDLAQFELRTRLDAKKGNPEQIGAMTSFAFNLGSAALRSSTLLRKHKAADYPGAANEFPRWNKAGGRVLRGLTIRREAEKRLYGS